MRMMVAAAVVCVAALAGCGPHSDAKEAVKKALVDPDSARFTGLQDGKREGDVCGFVNAKNRMGGFAGDSPFFYRATTREAILVRPPDTDDFRAVWLGIQARSDFMGQLSEVREKCQTVERWGEVCGQTMTTHHMCGPLSGDASTIYKTLKSAFGQS